MLDMKVNYYFPFSLCTGDRRMPAFLTSCASRETARGGRRLLKRLIHYVSSKPSTYTITTDCLAVTCSRRTGHTHSQDT